MVSTQTTVQNIPVTCIVKADRYSAHEGITHIGSATRKWTRAEVIAELEAPQPRYAFYTAVGVNRSWIGVVNGPNGKYLRSYADQQWNDNLLSLPSCI